MSISDYLPFLRSGETHEVIAPSPSIRGVILESSNRLPIPLASIFLFRKMCRLSKPTDGFKNPELSGPASISIPEGTYPVVGVANSLPKWNTPSWPLQIELSPIGNPDVETGWIGVDRADKSHAIMFDEKFSRSESYSDGTFSFSDLEPGCYALKVIGPDPSHRDAFLDWVKPETYYDADFELTVLTENGSASKSTSISLERGEWQVSERSLVELLPSFRPFTYIPPRGVEEPKYPFELQGFTLRDGFIGQVNNCCTFVEGLLIKAWQNVHGERFMWDVRKHQGMMNPTEADPFSPVTTLVNQGIATRLDPDEFPRDWTVVQKADGNGHTFMVVRAHPGSGKVLILESNTAASFTPALNGPGFRWIGRLDSLENSHPGNNWWAQRRIRTWAAIRRDYTQVNMAQLNVNAKEWID